VEQKSREDRVSDDAARPAKLFIPGLRGIYGRLSPLGYALMRASLGLILFPHGVNKLFFNDAQNSLHNFVQLGLPYPLAWAYFVGGVEFFGGAMLILGLFTRIAAAAIAVEMTVIGCGLLLPAWWWGQHGAEYVIFMALSALGILFQGGGRYSLDHLIGREL
jgi:putative oxidoreductase